MVTDGDVYFNCVAELKKNFDDEKSASLGVEFVATSISSLGDGYDTNKRHALLMQQDPHIKFYNAQRGYVRHVVTAQRAVLGQGGTPLWVSFTNWLGRTCSKHIV